MKELEADSFSFHLIIIIIPNIDGLLTRFSELYLAGAGQLSYSPAGT
jgi:hypothetical protein